MKTSAQSILDELGQRRVSLYVLKGKLHYSGPRGALTDELRQAIAGRKREIVALVGKLPAWDRETARLLHWFRRVRFEDTPETASLILWARSIIRQGPGAPEVQSGALARVLRGLFNQGDWDTARAFHDHGLTLARQERYEEAISALRQALELDPKLADAHYNLAAIYSRLGLWLDVDRELAETLRIDPAHEAVLAASRHQQEDPDAQ